MLLLFVLFVYIGLNDKVVVSSNKLIRYEPKWSDLDKRPLPEWYDKAKVGIFLHWGVFSVPSYGSEWFWNNLINDQTNYRDFMKKNYPPGFTYQEFAPMFTAEFFDPQKWASLFKQSGAKYIVLTSKHHEGFTLFPSQRSFSWNSVDTGPHRDLVGELSEAVRAEGLFFGVYHSLYEWFNPIYLEDKSKKFLTRNYPDTKLLPDLKQLVNAYKPSVIWSDGDWEMFDAYWNSTGFLAWLYNESPVRKDVVVNDRWGLGIGCHHGDFYNCADKYNPGTLQAHKWENAFTIDTVSWGYRREMELSDIMSIEQILKEIVVTVSCGGNALINVGPTKEGTISLIFQERLTTLGEWLAINGPGIYGSSPWHSQNDTYNGDVWYTCTKTPYDGRRPTARPSKTDKISVIYAITLMWPNNGMLAVRDVVSLLKTLKYKVELLGNEEERLKWTINNGIAYIQFPMPTTAKSHYAWTLKITPQNPQIKRMRYEKKAS